MDKVAKYEIYDIPDEEAIRTFTKLNEWKELLNESGTFGKNIIIQSTLKSNHVDPEKPLFRTISNQYITLEPLKPGEVATHLRNLCVEAGLQEGHESLFTTHTFRRGHAQHRFFHPKSPWTMTKLKRWAGWTQNENPNTIIR